jgi:hypothetical protein
MKRLTKPTALATKNLDQVALYKGELGGNGGNGGVVLDTSTCPDGTPTTARSRAHDCIGHGL